MLLLWSYLVYAVVAIGLTIWLASTLFRNGAMFLEDVFSDNAAMARAINHLLVVGFYMLNLGWAFLILRGDRPADGVEAVENLAMKLGQLLFTLGLIHFANLWVFQRIRRSRRSETIPPVQATFAGPVPQAAFAGGSPQPTWDGERWVEGPRHQGPQAPR